MEKAKTNKELVPLVETISLKQKIFNFFFLTLRKKDINIFFGCFLITIETIQLISYSFTEPHLSSWKIQMDIMSYITEIVGAPRITPLFVFLKFDWYLIIWALCLGYIFFQCLLITFVIKFNRTNSPLYKMACTITRYFSSVFTIVGLIPFMEILLLMVKCNKDSKVDIVIDSIACYQSLHILYAVLTYIFYICFFGLIMLSAIFYFDPFNNKSNSSKIDPSADLFFYIVKTLLVLQYIFIKDQWISIVIIIIPSILNLKKGFDEPSYKSFCHQCFIQIRNISLLWTGIVLLICKLSESTSFNGNVFLLLFAYPLIIMMCIIFYKNQSQNFLITSTNIIGLNDFLLKLKYLGMLIENYINKNKSQKSDLKYSKNDIYLQGYITIHNESCILEDCPLIKFVENSGHFGTQKTCLLHYMNILFVEGIKNFPNSRKLIMMFVQFNYQNKFNLNAAKTYLAKIEKESNTISEDYLIFCIQQSVLSQSTHNNNNLQGASNENDEMVKIEESIEQRFRKLKYLIESTTKLYSEFWGILAANLSNNLNLQKLYFIGNQLNEYLGDINTLWEKDLKSKKIELENQSIVQLYVYFIREILKNKAKSEEIAKKLNEEQHFDNKKVDNEKFNLDNLDTLLENQELIIFCRANEKGECKIIQCSNSIVGLLGYTKPDLIGQQIEIMMPGIFSINHSKMVQSKIKQLRATIGSNKSNDKKIIFILPKTKVGYLLPINSKFTIYNDDDFSNTFVIKSKFENKDSKSVYAFYILTKEDLTIDSFSSSSLIMGLTMDLLKKYVVNLNHLVRGCDHYEALNISENYGDYEEEPKRVTWIYPDKIYPKNDSLRNQEENIEKLIMESESKCFNLLITKMKYGESETIGFCFRFTDPEPHKNPMDFNDLSISTSRYILYDVLKLHFIRTEIVNDKTHKPNYPGRSSLKGIIGSDISNSATPHKVNLKKKKKGLVERIQSNSDEEDNNDDDLQKKFLEEKNMLTKEKILEYTAKGSEEIKEFIDQLAFYGHDVQLEKHRPNKERYPVGRFSEPLIKITISSFSKRIQDKVRICPDSMNENQNDLMKTSTTISSINTSSSMFPISSSLESISSIDNGSNVSASLSQIFNENSVLYIKIISLIMFLIISAMISFEFAFSYQATKNCLQRIQYVDKAFIILNSLLYTKFFITEGILAQDPNYLIRNIDTPDAQSYIIALMNEMSNYRQIFTNTYSYYSNASVTFSSEYNDYITNTQVTITTLSNNQSITEKMTFLSAMSRIPTSIFYVSTVNDNNSYLNMNDRNAYELMMNLLNNYLIIWRNATFLLVKDSKENAVTSNILKYTYGFSFLISIICLVSLWKLISRFIDDRERPVNLFLTIKKQKFNELKTSSEAFLNKLLNKFFGNEETEEESLIEYTSIIKADEMIMINKFKQKTEYKQSVRTSSEYLFNLIQMAVFFLAINTYMSFKYFYIDSVMKNINEYIDILNITHYSQSDIILSTNIFKSYYYNDTYPILNEPQTSKQFNHAFETITDIYKSLILQTFQTKTFLTSEYVDLFYKGLYSDISQLITKKIKTPELKTAISRGFASVSARYFEMHRFLAILYHEAQSKTLCYKMQYFEINETLQNIIRPWFDSLLKSLLSTFQQYSDAVNLIQDTIFIILLIAIIILYFFVWKSYEEKLKILLKTSVDLIKLIPEEIKKEIVKKLNEEEDKKE